MQQAKEGVQVNHVIWAGGEGVHVRGQQQQQQVRVHSKVAGQQAVGLGGQQAWGNSRCWGDRGCGGDRERRATAGEAGTAGKGTALPTLLNSPWWSPFPAPYPPP